MELLFLVRFPATTDSTAYNIQSVTQSVTYEDGSSGTSNYCLSSCVSSTTTTTTTTTSTTTTTPPFFESVSLKLFGRDSINNDPVAQAAVNVSFVRNSGQLLPVA